MPNQLADSLSPYLRQHADNPVPWQEWGADAFAEARRRGVPILLSVGYAACHWCHVMAHESFEDDEVAAALAEGYVSIKVDREERPDIDAVYMEVTQALTGHGGWPMTVFLTPDGHPLHAGTYYPRDQFLHVVRTIAEIWRSDRPRAVATGQNIVEAFAGRGAPGGADGLEHVDLSAAVATLGRDVDVARGGFGGAPKFPPSMTLEHLLRHHARTGDHRALEIVEHATEAMARGGLADQLDGGFARYSVDADWVVPHFEKMLYDNAQLLRVYAHLSRATGSSLARRTARATADFLLARLRTDAGAFASSLDADAAGVEGSTYVWTPQELVAVLGPDDGERVARLCDVTRAGTFEGGASTLQLRRDPSEVFSADDLGEDPDAWWARMRTALLAARDLRVQPARDDKVVTAWNGLAIAALAEAGRILDEPAYVAAAEQAARFVVDTHVVDGRLRRTSLDGRVGQALAGADDHGDLVEGLLVLFQATGNSYWYGAALTLLDDAARLFVVDGQVFDTGSDAEALFVRPTSSGDNAEPSGASALASASLLAFALTGEMSYRELMRTCLARLTDVMETSPRFAGGALATMEALAAGPVQVAIVVPGEPGEAELPRRHRAAEAFERATWQSTSPGLVRVVGQADTPWMPLLAQRPAREGRVTAYVCRGMVCDAPVTGLEELRRSLR